MTFGMASAAAVDATIKAMSGWVGIQFITMIVGFGMAITFAIACLRQGIAISITDLRHKTVLFRTACEVAGVYLIVLALSLVSLSEVTALSQTVPLLVTAGAVLFMGEKATLGDWGALLFGMCGMILIVRPASDHFQPALLLAVASAVVLSARDLASRAAPASVSTLQLGFWGGGALGLFSFVLFLTSGNPRPEPTFALLLGSVLIVLLASATFYGVAAAMRVGSVAVISPFRYTRLPFGIFLGVVLFSEKVDTPAALGAGMILLAGLAIWWRELQSGM